MQTAYSMWKRFLLFTYTYLHSHCFWAHFTARPWDQISCRCTYSTEGYFCSHTFTQPAHREVLVTRPRLHIPALLIITAAAERERGFLHLRHSLSRQSAEISLAHENAPLNFPPSMSSSADQETCAKKVYVLENVEWFSRHERENSRWMRLLVNFQMENVETKTFSAAGNMHPEAAKILVLH